MMLGFRMTRLFFVIVTLIDLLSIGSINNIIKSSRNNTN